MVGEHVLAGPARGSPYEVDVLLLGQRGGQAEDVLDDAFGQHRLRRELERPGLDAGDVEHLVDEVEEVASASEDLLDRVASVLVEVLGLEQLGEAEHRVERSSQLVAHARQELALGPVGLLCGLAGEALALLEALLLLERLPELGGAFLDQTERVGPASADAADQQAHEHRGQRARGRAPSTAGGWRTRRPAGPSVSRRPASGRHPPPPPRSRSDPPRAGAERSRGGDRPDQPSRRRTRRRPAR